MAAGVVVDRDGTLVDFVRDAELGVVTPAFHPDQLRLLPGVAEGLRAMRDAGLPIAVATNQPDAAKGRVPIAAIQRTNDALRALLAAEGIQLAAFETCLHHPEGGPGGVPSLIRACACRKPAPGMLLSIARQLGGEPSAMWMMGDTAADLGAATAAGMRCALVLPRWRCEICPMADGASDARRPELMAERFDALAAQLIASHRADLG